MQKFTNEDPTNPTVLAVLRKRLPGQPSWSAVRKLLRGRFVAIGGVLCLDEGRRLAVGETLTLADRAYAAPPGDRDVKIQFIDHDVVVVEKPAGMTTLRRNSEYAWPWEKRNRQPTLDECVPRLIAAHAAKKSGKQRKAHKHPRLYPVHRLDRDSSGLLVFARNVAAQTALIQQFAQRTAVRKYLAIVPGRIADQTIQSRLIRDRGDGLRGSTSEPSIGQIAITHVATLRALGDYSELSCRLETGRTNQIRIHLAEANAPICGDIKYRGPYGSTMIDDASGIQRLALHSTELQFEHPESGQQLNYLAPWCEQMIRFIETLNRQ